MHFQDLTVYNQASRLFPRIYNLVRSWKPFDQNHLGSQMIRATNSIHANLAEGQSRSTRDYIRFITMALGSCDEMRSHLLDCVNVGLLPQQMYRELDSEYVAVGKQLTMLRKSLQARLTSSP